MNDKEILSLKIDLLLNGVALNGEFDLKQKAFLSSVSDGIRFVIFDDIYITTSINSKSPYTLHKKKASDTISLFGKAISPLKVELIPEGKHFGAKSSDGTMMENIGTFQIDRLRISAYKGCDFVTNNEGCEFCEVSHVKIQRKNRLEHISELIKYTEQHENRVKHYLVSGGTPPDNGWKHFIEVCQTVREHTLKPIYAMFSPPPNLGVIKQIIDSGVHDLAINVELFNSVLSAKITKGKNKIGVNKYFEALEYAVKLLGNNGSVKSMLIVGLESYSDTLSGVEELAKRGVMPILSIFKPIIGTPLENLPAPSIDDLAATWEIAQNICEKYSLTLGPLCKCCQNNTLTIPVNDKYFSYE